MTYYDVILDLSLDNYGLVTFERAKEAGVSGSELKRLADSGRLAKVGRGVYQATARLVTPYDRFAIAVTLVGEGSMLWGASVLALLDLASANPKFIDVVTNKRVRRSLPSWVRIRKSKNTKAKEIHHGIPCQKLSEAILASRDSVMVERLLDAAESAHSKGLLTDRELRAIREELGLKQLPGTCRQPL